MASSAHNMGSLRHMLGAGIRLGGHAALSVALPLHSSVENDIERAVAPGSISTAGTGLAI